MVELRFETNLTYQSNVSGNLIFYITINVEYRLVDNEIISLPFIFIIFLIEKIMQF